MYTLATHTRGVFFAMNIIFLMNSWMLFLLKISLFRPQFGALCAHTIFKYIYIARRAFPSSPLQIRAGMKVAVSIFSLHSSYRCSLSY